MTFKSTVAGVREGCRGNCQYGCDQHLNPLHEEWFFNKFSEPGLRPRVMKIIDNHDKY